MAFFSYAWTNEAHKARVLALVNRLRHDGVNALIDQVNLQDGEDTYQFMERIATDPKLKKVVAVCDKTYAEKVDARKGGSGTEGTIMSPEVYAQIGDGPKKYVAVVFEVNEHGQAYVPTMFATRLYIDMSTDDKLEQNYLRLLRFLWDRPEPEVPLGEPPAILFETHPASVAAQAKGMLVRSAVERGRGVLTPWKEFTDTVIAPLSVFTAPWQGQQWDVRQALSQLETMRGPRDALAETVRFLIREDALRASMLVELFQALGNLPLAQARDWGVQPEATAHTRLAVIELVLYVVAVLIQEGRPDLLRDVLLSDYLEENNGDTHLTEFGFIRRDVQWFDQTYNDAFSTRWISPAGEWLKNRANLETVSWKDVMQADALLHLQSQVWRLSRGAQSGTWPRMNIWFAVTGPYWRYDKFILFLKFASQTYLRNWLPMFGAEDVKAFRELLESKGNGGENLLRFPQGEGIYALALEDIGTRG